MRPRLIQFATCHLGMMSLSTRSLRPSRQMLRWCIVTRKIVNDCWLAYEYLCRIRNDKHDRNSTADEFSRRTGSAKGEKGRGFLHRRNGWFDPVVDDPGVYERAGPSTARVADKLDTITRCVAAAAVGISPCWLF